MVQVNKDKSGERRRTWLGLDPSSQRTGYALLDNNERLLDGGYLTPNKTRDPAKLRVVAMCRELTKLLDELQPDEIVLEWTKGKVGKNRHKGGGAGLPIYGIAIGALWQRIEFWAELNPIAGRPRPVVTIEENIWTRGKPKSERQQEISRIYPAYKSVNDSGGDVADAAGIVKYWLREKICRSHIVTRRTG